MGRRPEDAVMRAAQVGVLLAAIGLGAFLRLDGLGRPSYWLDEILGDQLTTKAASEPLWRWVTGLEREHGPLYYATQLAGRVAGHDETGGRLPAAIFGMATLPLLAMVIRAPTPDSRISVLVGAILLAISPFHVYYSREARPYSLLMLLTGAVLVVLLGRGPVWLGAAAVAAMLYTSAVAAPVVVAVALVSAVTAVMDRQPLTRLREWKLAGAAALAIPLFPLLYGGVASRETRVGVPSIGLHTFDSIVRAFSVSAHGAGGDGRVVVAVVAAAICGSVVLIVRDRRSAVVLIGMALLPIALTAASLSIFGHWFSVRYAAAALIPLLALAAIGVSSCAGWLTAPLRSRWPRAREIAAAAFSLIVAVGIGARTWPAARREPFEKLDWRAIAAVLDRHVRPGDVVIAAEPWSDVSLRYYLKPRPGVRLYGVSSVPFAERLVSRAPASWLVTAGFSTTTAVREWICRYPLLAASRLEEFRLHYAPSAGHFLQERSGPAEVRALAWALGEHALNIQFGVNDEFLLGSGWAGVEGTLPDSFRWAVAHEATIAVPRIGRRPREIRIHALPVMDPRLPPNTIGVAVNGAVLGHMTMVNEFHDYVFVAPAAVWRDGFNTVAVRFGRITSPSSLHSSSTDTRTLAAAVDRVSVVDAGEPFNSGDLARVPPPRLASDALFGVRVPDRSRRTRLPSSRLSRLEVEEVLGRLGFDPEPTWKRIASGSVFLEDVAAGTAYEGACEDDNTFLESAFAALVQRHPNEQERRDLLARLRGGDARAEIVQRILRADDFRGSVLTP